MRSRGAGSSDEHFWAIVLAGGEGTRLRPLSGASTGMNAPSNSLRSSAPGLFFAQRSTGAEQSPSGENRRRDLPVACEIRGRRVRGLSSAEDADPAPGSRNRVRRALSDALDPGSRSRRRGRRLPLRPLRRGRVHVHGPCGFPDAPRLPTPRPAAVGRSTTRPPRVHYGWVEPGDALEEGSDVAEFAASWKSPTRAGHDPVSRAAVSGIRSFSWAPPARSPKRAGAVYRISTQRSLGCPHSSVRRVKNG